MKMKRIGPISQGFLLTMESISFGQMGTYLDLRRLLGRFSLSVAIIFLIQSVYVIPGLGLYTATSTDFFGIVSKRNAMYCVTIIQTVFASTGLLYYSCNNYYNLLFYSIGCSDHHILANSIVSWCNIPSTYFICHIPYISKSHGLYLRKTSQRHIYIYLYMYLSLHLSPAPLQPSPSKPPPPLT